MNGKILVVDNVTKRFGGLTANANISFSMNKGEIIGLIGPNGAGKSTLFNCISCFYNADSGKITFKGQAALPKDQVEEYLRRRDHSIDPSAGWGSAAPSSSSGSSRI